MIFLLSRDFGVGESLSLDQKRLQPSARHLHLIPREGEDDVGHDIVESPRSFTGDGGQRSFQDDESLIGEDALTRRYAARRRLRHELDEETASGFHRRILRQFQAHDSAVNQRS